MASPLSTLLTYRIKSRSIQSSLDWSEQNEGWFHKLGQFIKSCFVQRDTRLGSRWLLRTLSNENGWRLPRTFHLAIGRTMFSLKLTPMMAKCCFMLTTGGETLILTSLSKGVPQSYHRDTLQAVSIHVVLKARFLTWRLDYSRPSTSHNPLSPKSDDRPASNFSSQSQYA